MLQRFLSDKKAQIGMGMKPIIGIILAIIVILATVSVFVALLGMFTGGANQETTVAFNDFYIAIQTLASDRVPVDTFCFVQGSIDGDWGVIMFDADRPSLRSYPCTTFGPDLTRKPSPCGGARTTTQGCICLCDVGDCGADDNDCEEDGSECKLVPHFTKFYYPNYDVFDDADDPEDDPNDWKWWTGVNPARGWSPSSDAMIDGDSKQIFDDAFIYGSDVGGSSIWGPNVQVYILKKHEDGKLLIKRVPQGQTINGVDVRASNLRTQDGERIKTCRELADEIQQDVQSGAQTTVRS